MLTRMDASTKALEIQRQRAREICHAAKGSTDNKADILSPLFHKCGRNFTVWGDFFCEFGENISIGDDVFINAYCSILDGFPVTIGDRSKVGPHVGFYTTSHSLDFKERRRQIEYGNSIVIGHDVWIGGHVCVLPGVSIGNFCIIGAGSVVTKDLASGSILRGAVQQQPIQQGGGDLR